MEPAQGETRITWQGKAIADLPGAMADEAWFLLSSFCSLHLWIPGTVQTCRLIAGVEGQPGCVRYCASPPGENGKPRIWAYEELLAFDPAARTFRYKVADNNIGLKRFDVAFKVADGDGGGGGCKLEWSFDCDPAAGWSEESITAFLQSGIEEMAKSVEEALRVAGATAVVVN
ncbi:hypothetical protein Cni_G10773 [Canna indica]|uniref:Lachrymatory factor synthase n=1 Tax=Canna indica TaxID=4628 RepID=A0AAQ3Q8W2_9LILI|nr:hypothetical protein Cni_G10773 [Canna indica]